MKLFKVVLLSTLGLIMVAPLVNAQQVPPPSLPTGVIMVTSVEGITEYSLPNGLHVLLFPDGSKSTITVNVTYTVGSRQESYGETGMAHLLEHMLFKGTPTHSHIPKELNDHGAQFNASTAYDRTNYFETLPASEDNLKLMLGLESDRMINSTVSRKDLDSEMTVVRNEFERGENSPGNVLFQRMAETAYIAHAYGRPVIGFRSDIEDVPIEMLQAFYHKYYQPDDAVLTVAGQIDPMITLLHIVDTFGAIPRPTRLLASPYTLEPEQDGDRSATVTRVGDIQIVGSMYHIPASSDQDYPPLEVLTSILANAPSGRLYKALVESGKASSVNADLFLSHDPGLLYAMANLNKSGNAQDTASILQATMETFAKAPPTKEEVDRARISLLTDRERTLNDSSRLGFDLSEWIGCGDWRLFFLDRDRIRAVTTADVERVAAKYLISSNRTAGVFEPATQPPVRAQVPPLGNLEAMLLNYKGQKAIAQGEAFDPIPANLDKRTVRIDTKSGLKIALLELKTRGGLVYANFVFHYGSPTSLPHSAVPAQLMAAMLQRGTDKHTRQQIQDELDHLKATLSISSSDVGSLRVQLQTTHENLKAAVELVSELLQQAAFPPEELEPLKRQALTQSESQRHDPNAVAGKVLGRLTSPYPSDSPRYIETLDEREDSIKSTTVDSLKALHSQLNANNADMAFVGDFDSTAVQTEVEGLFGSWKSSTPFARVPQEEFSVVGQHQVIEIPDKANAVYLSQINLKIRDTDPDYPALLMAAEMMGGGTLHSRLADRIRQKDGLSYAVSLQLYAAPLDSVGSVVNFAIFAPQNLSRIEEDFREEFAKAAATGFTADELNASRQGWLRRREVSRGQNADVAGVLSNYLFLDRTFAYDAGLETAVDKVTLEQATAALKEYMDPAKFVVVTAGSFNK
jgi:zinc protease